jgi:excisionase family DNA binding protein
MIENPYMPKVILALSVNATADALQISRRVLAKAIGDGAITPYKNGTKVRLLTSDIDNWVRSWPVATQRKNPRNA